VGADRWAVEAVPGEDKNRPFRCHQWWITMNGIYTHEGLDVAQLAADRIYGFAQLQSSAAEGEYRLTRQSDRGRVEEGRAPCSPCHRERVNGAVAGDARAVGLLSS
jgi:hypothetical protein